MKMQKIKTYFGIRIGSGQFILSSHLLWSAGMVEKSISFSTNKMFGLMREHSMFLLLGNLHIKANFNTLNDSPSLMMLPAVVIQLKFLATKAISVCSNIYTLALLFNRCYSVSGGNAGERGKHHWNRTHFFHGNRVLSWHL